MPHDAALALGFILIALGGLTVVVAFTMIAGANVQIEDARVSIVPEQRVTLPAAGWYLLAGESGKLLDFGMWDLRFTLQNAVTGAVARDEKFPRVVLGHRGNRWEQYGTPLWQFYLDTPGEYIFRIYYMAEGKDYTTAALNFTQMKPYQFNSGAIWTALAGFVAAAIGVIVLVPW